MFMAIGAAAGALSYLQSLLAQGAGGTRGASNANPLSGSLGLGDPSPVGRRVIATERCEQHQRRRRVNAVVRAG